VDANLLVLFHGVGDRANNFASFGKQLKLPQTAVLALEAPRSVLDLGFEWFPWFDAQGNGTLSPIISWQFILLFDSWH